MIFPLNFYMEVRPYFWTILTLNNILSFITFISSVLKKHYSASIKVFKVNFHSSDNCFSLKHQIFFSSSCMRNLAEDSEFFFCNIPYCVYHCTYSSSLHSHKIPNPFAQNTNCIHNCRCVLWQCCFTAITFFLEGSDHNYYFS